MAVDLRLAVTDNPVGELPIHIKCPDGIHGLRLGGKKDRTNSLAVYPNGLHCFGCGLNLNVWTPGRNEPPDTYVHPLTVLLNITHDEAMLVESRYSSEALDAYRERVEQESNAAPLHPAFADIYAQVLQSARAPRRAWLHDRGLTDRSIERAKIGHDGTRFVLPVFDETGQLLTFRYRRDDEYMDDKYPKYCGMAGRNGFFLYPLGQLDPYSDTLFICEGEFDALLLNQLGYTALTATNGAGQAHKIPAIVKERWPHITHIVVATDQDEAGHEAARLTLQAAQELGFNAERLTWEAGKDVTDAWRLGKLPLGRD